MIRSLFGQIDGVSSGLREATVALNEDLGLGLTEKEVLKLQERRRTQEGLVVKMSLSPDESLKVACRYFPRLFGSRFELATKDPEWKALRELKKSRDAFTHPRELDDLAPINSFSRIEASV
jgi:hypothetical protein